VPDEKGGCRILRHSGWTASLRFVWKTRARYSGAAARSSWTHSREFGSHILRKMLVGQAREFISRMQAEARRLAYRAMRELESRTREQGVKLTRCGLLLASGRPLPDLEKILASHALIHTADGELFREAIIHASARSGLTMWTIKERELLERAGQAFRMKSAALLQRVTELGRPFGAPWTQDEKFATLAAWLALASKPARTKSG
jgi:hypothetical protein